MLKEKTIDIVEIFGEEGNWAIQGEGGRVGTPSMFIRTFGCNLKCRFGLSETDAKRWEKEVRSYPAVHPTVKLEELPIIDVG
jgi:organic radical activating enzyme